MTEMVVFKISQNNANEKLSTRKPFARRGLKKL
jgi:hypothetical protein